MGRITNARSWRGNITSTVKPFVLISKKKKEEVRPAEVATSYEVGKIHLPKEGTGDQTKLISLLIKFFINIIKTLARVSALHLAGMLFYPRNCSFKTVGTRQILTAKVGMRTSCKCLTSTANNRRKWALLPVWWLSFAHVWNGPGSHYFYA